MYMRASTGGRTATDDTKKQRGLPTQSLWARDMRFYNLFIRNRSLIPS